MVSFGALFRRTVAMPLTVEQSGAVIRTVTHGHRYESRLVASIGDNATIIAASHRFLTDAVEQQWPPKAHHWESPHPELRRMRYVLVCLRLMSGHSVKRALNKQTEASKEMREALAIVKQEVQKCSALLKEAATQDRQVRPAECAQLALGAFVVDDAASCQIALQTLAEAASTSPTALLSPDVARVIAETSSRVQTSAAGEDFRRLSTRALAPVLERAVEHAGGGLKAVNLLTHEALIVLAISPRLVARHIDEMCGALAAFPTDSVAGFEAADRLLGLMHSAYPELIKGFKRDNVATAWKHEPAVRNAVRLVGDDVLSATDDSLPALQVDDDEGKIDRAATCVAVHRLIASAMRAVVRGTNPVLRTRALKSLTATFRLLPHIPPRSPAFCACREATRYILRALARVQPGDDWLHGSFLKVLHFVDPDADWNLLQDAVGALPQCGYTFLACDLFRAMVFNQDHGQPRHAARTLVPAIRNVLQRAMKATGAPTDLAAYSAMRADDVVSAAATGAPFEQVLGRRQLILFTSQGMGLLEALALSGQLEPADTAMVNAVVLDILMHTADADPRTIARILRAIAPLDIRVRGVIISLQRTLQRRLLAVPEDRTMRLSVASSVGVALATFGHPLQESLATMVLSTVNFDMSTAGDPPDLRVREALYHTLARRVEGLTKVMRTGLTRYSRYMRRHGAVAEVAVRNELLNRVNLPGEFQRLLLRAVLRCLANEVRWTRESGTVASSAALTELFRSLFIPRNASEMVQRKFVTGLTRLVGLYAHLADPAARAAGLAALTTAVQGTPTLPRPLLTAVVGELQQRVLVELERHPERPVPADIHRAWVELASREHSNRRMAPTTLRGRQLDLLAATLPTSLPTTSLVSRARVVKGDSAALEAITADALTSRGRGRLCGVLDALAGDPSA
jgi:hypothetical protein